MKIARSAHIYLSDEGFFLVGLLLEFSSILIFLGCFLGTAISLYHGWSQLSQKEDSCLDGLNRCEEVMRQTAINGAHVPTQELEITLSKQQYVRLFGKQ